MSNRPRVYVNFIIIPPLEALITEEVDRGVLDTADVFLCLNVLEAVCFVPASGEHVERDLAAD